MNIYSILIYLLLISVPLLIVYQSYLLKYKYSFGFLNSFFYYIIFFYAYAFIAFSTRIFFTQIGIQDSNILNMVLSSIIFPLNIVSIYYFLKWTGELIGKPVTNRLKIIYGVFQFIAFILFFVTSLNIAETGQSFGSGQNITLINLIELTFFIYPCILLIFFHKKINEKKVRTFALILGVLYLVLFPLLLILIEFFHIPHLIFNRDIFVHYFLTITLYFVNIPPILYIRWFLKKNHQLIIPDNRVLEKDIFINLGITDSEVEIIRLIIKGKTNESIGDALFCSTKTVKNKITAIYKKMGVKSRVELVSLVLSNPEK